MVDSLVLLLAGAVISSLSTMVGIMIGRRRTKMEHPATCPCTHVISVHAEDGHCQEQVKRRYYGKNGHGGPDHFQWVPCPCRQYMGPELITDMHYPGLAIVKDQDKRAKPL